MVRGNLQTKGLWAALAVAAMGTVPRTHAQAPGSVWDGIYTNPQAERGATFYRQECESCHGKALEGAGQTPPLAGDEFKSNWNGQPLSRLFGKMRTSMPADHPGKLTAGQNADILSYMLKQNGFPAGSTELQGDAETLKAIRFESVKPGK
jgi:mono/diheme cytochrome c family protein